MTVLDPVTRPAIDSDALALTPPAPRPDLATELFEPLSIGQMVDRIGSMAVEKASQPWALLVRSLVAGAMVSFGVLLSLTVSTGIETPGLASLVMGLAFGMSFVLILASGASLITADMAAGALAVLQRRLSMASYGRMLVIGMAGNLLGAFVFIAVVAAAGGPYLGAFADRAAQVATAKTDQNVLTAFMLAVLCTWFLQTAMCMYFKARSDVARMGFAFYGPFAFVIGATQHVIANVGFLALPLLLALFHGGAAPEPTIGWGLGEHGMVTNLLILTAGNLVGGVLFVALPFQAIAALQRRGR